MPNTSLQKRLGDIRPVQEEMIHPLGAHSPGRRGPDIRVFDHGTLFRQRYFTVDLEPVAGADGEAVALFEAGLIGLRFDHIDRVAKRLHVAFHLFKLVGASNLEGDKVEASLVGKAQGEGVVIKFIIAFETNPAVVGTAHLVQPQDVFVEIQRFVKIQYPKLHKTWPKRSFETHCYHPFIVFNNRQLRNSKSLIIKPLLRCYKYTFPHHISSYLQIWIKNRYSS